MSGSSNAHKNYFEFVRSGLAKVNIKITPEYKTWSTYLQATERGDFQIASSAWAADYPDPENFYQLFYGPNKPPGQNSSGFDNPRYNQLYEDMRFMKNGPERFAKIKEMAKILQEETPAVLDYTALISGLIQKWVTNFKRNMMVSSPFKYLNIDLATEEQMRQNQKG